MTARTRANISRHLRLAFWNADGVWEQRLQLKHFLKEQKIDILLLNESHLKPRHNLKIQNYDIIRTDRDGPKGGTAIIIKSLLPYTNLQLPPLQSIEATAISLLTPGQPIHLIAAYKSPPVPIVINDLRNLGALGPRVIIGGDLNAKHPHWHSRISNRTGTTIYQNLHILDITPTASPEPTHFPKNGGRPDVLDMAFIKGITITAGPHAINALDSDHIPVQLDIDHHHTKFIRSLPPLFITNWDKYKQQITNSTVTTLPMSTPAEIDYALQLITANIKSAIRCSTTKLSAATNNPEAEAQELRTQALIGLKRWARNKWQTTRLQQYKTLWNYMKRKIQLRLRRIDAQNWNEKLLQLDEQNREFWLLAKSLAKKDTSKPARPIHGPQGLVYTPEDKAEVFANHLEDQFTVNPEPYDEQHIRTVNRQLSNTPLNDPFLPATLTTPREIRNTIHRLRTRSAAGPDGISPAALKNAPRKLLVYLTRLFNAMLQLSHFPDQWKTAKVLMLPKPGKDTLFASNYRPISLLSVISKVFERLLHKRLYQHINAADLFPSHQFGFRPGLDTVSQLTRVIEETTLQFNKKGHTIGIFLDTAKAFDRVWHQGLLAKLIDMNFHHQFIRLLQSYLHNRSFYVTFNGYKSNQYPIQAGVPQGSVLAPLLFNLYSADIPTHPHTILATFADDTAIFSSHRNLRFTSRYAQQHLEQLEEWTTKWRINLNSDKTQVVHFTKKHTPSPPPLTLFDIPLPFSPSARYLGLQLDRRLTFKLHLQNTAKRALQRLLQLFPLLRSNGLSMQARTHIFLMMIRPILTYAVPAWQHAAPSNLLPLQRIQNRAIRIITGHSRDTRIAQLHEDLAIPLLHDVMSAQCRSFWHRSRYSIHQKLQDLGTSIPPRRTHKMPRPS